MKYILEIDDKTSIVQHLLGLVKVLLKKEKGVSLLSETEIEKREDLLLDKMIEESLRTGLADKDKVLSMLRSK